MPSTPISEQHVAVSFNAETTKHNYKNKVIWVLFFNRSSPGDIRYAEKFLSLEKSAEIAQYIKSPEDMICNKLKSVYGMDCKTQAVEDTGSENNLTLKADMVSHSFIQNELDKKANIDHLHNGSDIMAGKIKAEFIDEAICCDSELSEAIAALKNGGNQTSIVLPIPTPNAMSKRVDRLELQMKENMALRAEVKALKKNGATASRPAGGGSPDKTMKSYSAASIFTWSTGNQATDGTPNGRGNLIVGYNEAATTQISNARNGSHNLIIGKNHS